MGPFLSSSRQPSSVRCCPTAAPCPRLLEPTASEESPSRRPRVWNQRSDTSRHRPPRRLCILPLVLSELDGRLGERNVPTTWPEQRAGERCGLHSPKESHLLRLCCAICHLSVTSPFFRHSPLSFSPCHRSGSLIDWDPLGRLSTKVSPPLPRRVGQGRVDWRGRGDGPG